MGYNVLYNVSIRFLDLLDLYIVYLCNIYFPISTSNKFKKQIAILYKTL